MRRRCEALELVLALALVAPWVAPARAAALMPTLVLPLPSHHPHALGFDMRNLTSEMLELNAPLAANNSQCREDSLWYRQQTLAAAPWALRMYDSSTKVPDGLLTGNVVQLGNFDECLATHALDADGHGLFWGQYCLAGLAVERAWPPPNASAPAPANNFSNHLLAALAGHRLQWAVCLPASCAPEDLEAHLQARMPELLLADAEAQAPPFELRASVRAANCYRARATQLDEADWGAM